MCGIVGAVANRNVVSTLIEGLSRLEYRGYDSAGVAVLGNGGIERVRAVGRVANMTEKAEAVKLSGQVGIGHTRWATHGGVTESNAHPHVSKGEVAVVHNGIIENHDEQRTRLKALGYEFTSQTDTEVIAHLIHYYHALGATSVSYTHLAKRSEGKEDPTAILVNLLKAEAIKILVIIILLVITFNVYKQLVPFALIAGLAAAAIFSGAALSKLKA